MASTPESRAKAAAYAREDRKINPDKWADYDLKKHYGITLVEYNQILAQQNGVCSICGGVEKAVKNNSLELRRMAVDHCHNTGKVRGLLCTHCNQGIGNFRDNPAYLAKAISYLLSNGP